MPDGSCETGLDRNTHRLSNPLSCFELQPGETLPVVALKKAAVTCPEVLEAAAVAQPDEHSGEVVALFIVRKNESLTEKQIIDWCRKSLAGYKVPKHVYFKAELPKTNVGKILRKALREELSG